MFIKFIRGYIFRLWHWYTLGILALALTNIVTLAIPRISKNIVNALQNPLVDPISDANALKKLAFSIILLGVVQMIVRATSRILIFWSARDMELHLRNDLFSKVLKLPQSFYDKFSLGDLISRLANDIGHIRVLFAFGFLQLVNLLFLVIFTVSQMLEVHTLLTVATLSPLVMLLMITYFAMPILTKYSKKQQEILAKLTNKVTESFVNVQSIKLMAAEEVFVANADIENQKSYEIDMKVERINNILWPSLMMQHNLAVLIALFYGGYLVIESQIQIGDIMAFSIYVSYLSFPIMAFGFILGIIQRARTALERINEIQTEPEEASFSVKDVQRSQALMSNAPLLDIRGLSFRYKDSQRNVLDHIKFGIRDKEHIGLFGPIGCGKTTLFKLLTRIYNPPTHKIFLSTEDITSMELATLRKKVFLVEQQPQLLSMSIRENLTFGLSWATPEEVEQACVRAHILEDIRKMPNKFATQIGEKGLRLSGGQKQRLSLARGFLRNPALLILDDVLSAVDHATEKEIIEGIFKSGCALLISSHRLSVLKKCDKIVLMNEDGGIDAIDTYKNLEQTLAVKIAEYETMLQSHLTNTQSDSTAPDEKSNATKK